MADCRVQIGPPRTFDQFRRSWMNELPPCRARAARRSSALQRHDPRGKMPPSGRPPGNPMTTSSDREMILERVRRLFALSNDSGATAGESTTAAKMAARLMAQYQLSEADLRVSRDEAGAIRID